MTRLAIAIIRFYQRHLSRFTGDCRYQPSCSQYSLEAYRRFGFLWGSALTIGRLARCTPWGGFGADPVPIRRDGQPDRAL